MSNLSGVKEGYYNTLRSKLYGLLCEYEKGREWEKFLNTILIELEGFPQDERVISWYQLYHKISSLRYLRYEYFRSTIFDAISLISKLQGGNDDAR